MNARLLSLLLAITLSAAPFVMTRVRAADYPDKPIQWLLGYTAGGASDTIARTIAQKLPDVLGQPVIIENMPGASGIIAGNAAAKAAPDGYTILLVSTGFLSNIALGRKMAFDPRKDLTAVTDIGIVPNIVVVNPKLPVHSIKELIALAKSEPGKLNYASGGIGTGTHLATELFKSMTGINMTHIPYKGTPPALIALIAGRVQVMFAGAPPALSFVRAGKLRAIAVTSPGHSPVAPNLPPVAETVPGYSGVTWYGVVVPTGVPQPVIRKLNEGFKKVMTDPSVKETLLKRGLVAGWCDPVQAEADMKTQIDKYHKVIKEAGIHVH